MRWAWPTLALLLLGACEPPQTAIEATGPGPAPLVVYVPSDSAVYTAELFAGFTAETGVRVTIRHDESEANVDNVIHNRGTPRADVLIAPGIYDIWRAADQGALRPIASERLARLVAERFRDPDNLWVALALRPVAIVYDVRIVEAGELLTYASLADRKFAGQLCLTSSALSSNRALVAMLIDQLGKREAELLVRGWVANLALPPLVSQAALLEAVSAGKCSLGLVAASDRAPVNNIGTLRYRVPQAAFGDIDGIGIARHASQPELAREFVEWLIAEPAYADRIRGAALEPIAVRNVGIAGWHYEDAVRLVERAAYR